MSRYNEQETEFILNTIKTKDGKFSCSATLNGLILLPKNTLIDFCGNMIKTPDPILDPGTNKIYYYFPKIDFSKSYTVEELREEIRYTNWVQN